MIQGTGSLPATVAPPATEGFSAVRFVWMLSDGMSAPSERSWPDGSHRFAPALKRLAKMFVGSPKWKLGSYHATQGTVRPAPAKSIDGASASTVGSMLSDAGEPWVTHAPFLKARTNICWESPSFCSNVAQGTWTLPATTVPPATSTRPASGATVSRSSPTNACAASSSVSGLHRELRGRAGNRGRLVADPRPRYTAHHDSVHHRDARGDTLHQAAAFPRNLAAPPTPGSAAGWHLGRLARGPLGVRADHELPLSPDLGPGSVVARRVASVR